MELQQFLFTYPLQTLVIT